MLRIGLSASSSTMAALMARRSASYGAAAPYLFRSISVASWSTVDADGVSGSSPHRIQNLVNGEWTTTQSYEPIVDPLNGEEFIFAPATSVDELKPFVSSLKACPKHGLHNPFKNVERYLMLGEVSAKAAEYMRNEEVRQYFGRLIQRVSPKSMPQALMEVDVTRKFLENFSGDNVRYLARSFGVPGDHLGQMSRGYRVPFGPVALITPFNFPLEIPALQIMGALYMGNKPVMKVDSKVSIVMEQWLRMLHECGLPATDIDMINSDGPTMQRLLRATRPRNTMFTGSSHVAERLARDLAGRVKLEDAGFDWKILGPDVRDIDYVAWQADQDAYACTGQKCSAQSLLFAHKRWINAGLLDKLKARAAMRSLDDLTVGPVLTWTTEAMLEHVDNLLKIPGAKLLWGGKELENHTIPKRYGAIEPTAVFIPMTELAKARNFKVATTEVFGPLQVVTSYTKRQLPRVLQCLEKMHAHLTAAVVSNDAELINQIMGHSVNGTTYVGRRGRTTGAPQNHWFGPAGDPRAGGIGTIEAIQLVWSCHREIIHDIGPVPSDWVAPKCT